MERTIARRAVRAAGFSIVPLLFSVAFLSGCAGLVKSSDVVPNPKPTSTAATPVITPATGTYTTAQTVTITDATAGATIYYTKDGTTPTINSTLYAGSFSVSATTTVEAIAVASGFTNSAVASSVITISAAAAMPVITPATGTYASAQTVTITDATAGAAIFYTKDGTVPTVNSTMYTGSFSVSATTTVKAIAGGTGFSSSPVATSVITINVPVAAVPVITPATGSYTGAQTVTITDATAGATIFYTKDGTTPTVNSTMYTGSFSVGATTTVEAIAVASGFTNSAVATSVISISAAAAATPVITPATGSYTAAQSVTITDATLGATIYYTLNGSTPSTSSTIYTAAIPVSATTTVKAIAAGGGFASSTVATSAITINLPVAATPVIAPVTGTYKTPQSATITDATPGATIYYTLNGSTPSTSSTVYTAAIPVNSTTTVKAIAAASGFTNSGVTTSVITINLAAAAVPVITPATGSYAGAQTVTITDSTAGATIFYTKDGTTPTVNSTMYTGSFSVSATTTVEAIAVASGFTNSAVASSVITISAAAAGTPVITPTTGTYTAAKTVTITDATPGATIYYTLNGSTPSTNSTVYTAAIPVNSTTTVKAIAAGGGFASSTVATSAITINLPVAATPVIAPATGTYTSAQTVTITDATAGAAIFYTKDGTVPTVNSTMYTGSFSVSATTTVKAIAGGTGFSSSPVATSVITINVPVAAVPVITPATGSYTGAQTVTITDATAGATIFYTKDGTTPTVNSTMYTGSFSVSATTTVEAIAVASGFTNSAVATSVITISLPVATVPVIAPVTGTYTTTQSATITDATPGATIYYTLDGSSPSTNSTVYTAAIPVNSTTTVKAIAAASGFTNSGVTTSVITINLSAAAVPVIAPATGTYTTAQSVTITDATPGATIYYTLDGSTPSTSSTVYTAAIPVASTTTVKAIAAASGFANSGVATSVITISVSSGNISVTISPKRGGLTLSQTLPFTATVTNDVGSAGVTWSASAGSFSSQNTTSAAYVAPNTAGVVTVTATSVADGSKSASATVGVTSLTGVTTYHNDLSRDGVNAQEYALTTSNVTTATFGKLFSCAIDAAAYAQPLWVANLAIAGGTHNVVFAASSHDSVYAFDADASPCVTYWHKQLLGSGETWVSSGDVGTSDINPSIGIVGTPVIDPATQTLYVVSKSEDQGSGCSPSSSCHQRLHALSLVDGSEKMNGPVDITSAISVSGTGDGSSGGTVAFNTLTQNQRPGLALVNGVVYITWASHGDNDPYHGWVIGYSSANLTQAPIVFNDSPNGSRSGIWMSGGAPAADSSNNLYLITGNGTYDGTANSDYGDTFLKLSTSGGVSVSDWFTPADQSSLEGGDTDFGSGGAAILVDQLSSPVPHLVIGGGKEGNLFLLNRDNMGKFNATNKVVQTLAFGQSIFATGAFWNNSFYLAGVSGHVKTYSFNTSTGMFNTSAGSQSPTSYGFPGATPAVSATGTTNGVIWAIDSSAYGTPGPSIVHAYDATNLASELWNSSQAASSRDKAGNAVKFTVPTISNGKVYVGTQSEITVFGLLPN